MKLWKVTVNNLGWDCAKTFYATSRDEAVAISRKYPASDGVVYAGNFSEENAKSIIADQQEYFDYWAYERAISQR